MAIMVRMVGENLTVGEEQSRPVHLKYYFVCSNHPCYLEIASKCRF